MGGYGVKGCAWNVVLDGLNETIAIPEMASSGNESYEDIIGPDVDFGFVLAKHGRDGHTIVDAGLAHLVGTFGDDPLLRADPHESVEPPVRLEERAAKHRTDARRTAPTHT